MSYAHLVSTAATSSNGDSVTTGAIDTSGASLIVVQIADFKTVGVDPTTLSDSKGNSWNELTAHESSASRSRLFWSSPTSVGSGHTFTATGTGAIPSIAVSAFSGAHASPFDQQNGNFADGLPGSLSTGSVTPSEDNELIVAGLAANTGASTVFSINLSFTIGAQVSSDSNISVAIAYLIQTTAGARNPAWSWDLPVFDAGASIATFKASGGAPAVNNTRRSQFMSFFPPTTR